MSPTIVEGHCLHDGPCLCNRALSASFAPSEGSGVLTLCDLRPGTFGCRETPLTFYGALAADIFGMLKAVRRRLAIDRAVRVHRPQ